MVVNRGEVDDYYVKDGHIPIISREVWDIACALRKDRCEKMGKKRGMKKPDPWPESSFGACPYCGKHYFIKRLTSLYSYYVLKQLQMMWVPVSTVGWLQRGGGGDFLHHI